MEIHASGLLSTLVVSLAFAFAGGMAARMLRLPTLVGYLLAGVIVGPFTPGVVADQKIALELADIGVALLLFGVGLHFSPSDLWRTWRIVIPGAVAQILLTTATGFAVARFLVGLTAPGSLIVGLCLAIASTAVATRALAERGRLDTTAGRIALGWLVVQDIVVILALVLVPVVFQSATTPSASWLTGIGQVVLQLAGFVIAMSFAGRRFIPWLLGHVARMGSRELFTLAVIVIALGIASASTFLFGISMALGAFVAGVVLGESDLSHQAAAETLPVQQIFTVLFFVSVGMLIDPMSLLRMPLEIVSVLASIIIGAGLTTLVILLLLRCPVETAAFVGAAFAQIGEFSFVLTELAYGQGQIDIAGRNLVLAAAFLSIVVNPAMFRLAIALAPRIADLPPLRRWRAGEEGDRLPQSVTLTGHAIVVGHGRVGSLVTRAFAKHGLPFVIIESDRARAEKLKALGWTVIYGDATRQEVLAAASPREARLLVVALPDAFHARHVIALARKLNPGIETVVRTHSNQEAAYLEQEAGVGLVVMGEREVALSMSDFALQRLGVASAEAQATVNSLR
jgi:CPA2 family monovalent cation:H+ antiporter-2